jgi:hypothetical protein
VYPARLLAYFLSFYGHFDIDKFIVSNYVNPRFGDLREQSQDWYSFSHENSTLVVVDPVNENRQNNTTAKAFNI